MSSEQVLERRAAQRFDLNLPVSARLVGSERVGCGFTQNVSARGALFHTDLPMVEADAVEIGLAMPSEITLAESMRVRCRGKVLRVLPSAAGTGSVVAVQFEGYEFLPEAEGGSSTFARISALHEHPHEGRHSPASESAIADAIEDQSSVEPKSSMRSFPRP
jgi:PilZ domain